MKPSWNYSKRQIKINPIPPPMPDKLGPMSLSLKNYRDRLFQCFAYELQHAKNLLDIGCGDGTLWTMFFADKAELVIGLDITTFSSWHRQKMGNLHFLRADAHFLPFRDNTFDIVFEKDTLHHLHDPKRALCEMKRITKNKVILMEATKDNPISLLWMVKIKGHNHFSRFQLHCLVKDVFENTSIKIIPREVHYVPLPNFLLFLFNRFQDIFEKYFKKIANYNILLIEKFIYQKTFPEKVINSYRSQSNKT